MGDLRSVVGVVCVCVFSFPGLARAEAPPVSSAPAPQAAIQPSPPAGEGYFWYPLRAGESLTGVSRIFGIPVNELMELNKIPDPNNIPLGQTLKIPNAFARQTSALQAERSRLLEEKSRTERESAERQLAAARLEDRVRRLEAEKGSVAAELAAVWYWQTAAKLACFLFLGALVWAFKSRSERALLAKRLKVMEAEKAALTAAKERYREASVQLELRYQKLFSGKSEAPREVVSDGVARLGHAFKGGTAEIEHLLAQLRVERERAEQIHEAERRVLAWLFHPVRELRLRVRTS